MFLEQENFCLEILFFFILKKNMLNFVKAQQSLNTETKMNYVS